MTAVCPSSILACGMRVTLLDSQGNVASGSNNVWVTDKLIEISTTPEIEAPTDLTMKSGCDRIIATYRGPELFKRHTFEISLGSIEPGLLSMMIGADVYLDGTDPIGLSWPGGIACDDVAVPQVALEVWSYAWECAGQSPTWPYIHWAWPGTRWQIGPATLGATDFFRPALTGFSFANPLWGFGPYDDDPGDVIGDLGAFWFTDETPPTALCGYQTVVPSS